MSAARLIWGLHAATHFISRSPQHLLCAYIDASRKDHKFVDLKTSLEVCGCHVRSESKGVLDKMAGGGNHQGVILEVRAEKALNESDLDALISDRSDQVLIVILDSVQDPRNLGACLRVADGAGADVVVAPKNRAAGLSESARKVASGAAIPFVQVTNLARTMRHLKTFGIFIIGTSDAADSSVFEANLTGPLALVLGGEEKGMRRLTRETCDALLSIPMKGAVSSLNVSVATGIVLYEAIRQRTATS